MWQGMGNQLRTPIKWSPVSCRDKFLHRDIVPFRLVPHGLRGEERGIPRSLVCASSTCMLLERLPIRRSAHFQRKKEEDRSKVRRSLLPFLSILTRGVLLVFEPASFFVTVNSPQVFLKGLAN